MGSEIPSDKSWCCKYVTHTLVVNYDECNVYGQILLAFNNELQSKPKTELSL